MSAGMPEWGEPETNVHKECAELRTKERLSKVAIDQLRARVAELESAGAKAAMHWSDAQNGFQCDDLTEFRRVLGQSYESGREEG